MVYINSIAYYLPEKILSNLDISKEHPEWSVDKISSKIGIEKRHIAKDEESSGDLAYKAAELLLRSLPFDRREIDYIILCTQSPDYFLPSTSCVIQDKLGLSKKSGAFDFNLGCSGYIYGLGVAKGLILTNQANKILLLTGETYTKFINPLDKGNKTIFGDAGTATLISKEKVKDGINASILDFCYGTDGSGAENLIVKNGALRNKQCTSENKYDENGEYISNDSNLFMNGKEIFNFTAFKVPPLIKDVTSKNNTTLEEVDFFIFHQANEFMLNTVRKRCGIPEEKFYIDIKDIGNTVSNTIPIALFRSHEAGLLKEKKNLLLSGFGVGLSMAAVLIKL